MTNVALAPPAAHALEWVALTLTPGLGPTRSRKLVEHFGTAEAVFQASLTELESTGIRRSRRNRLPPESRRNSRSEELARAANAGVTVLPMDDLLYPPRLKEIYDPPFILYVRGEPGGLTKLGIAMVGTRHPTPYGSGMAERLACDLAGQGLVIIGGMARGVDTTSHRGAIAAKGKTVAVFGTGADVIYPKENSRLSEQILAFGGALVSEFSMGSFAAPQNFPIRNRILSGMSIECSSSKPRNVRHAHHGAARARAESRCVCRAGHRYQQEFLGAEYPHQTGRQAGCDLGRCLGRSPGRSTTCVDARLST